MGKGKMRQGHAKSQQVMPGWGPPVTWTQRRAGRTLPCLSAVRADPRPMVNPGSLLENSRLVLGSREQGFGEGREGVPTGTEAARETSYRTVEGTGEACEQMGSDAEPGGGRCSRSPGRGVNIRGRRAQGRGRAVSKEEGLTWKMRAMGAQIIIKRRMANG